MISNIQQEIISNVDFNSLSQWQWENTLQETPEIRQEMAKSLAKMYNLDQLDSLLEDPKCAQCGHMASQRCSRCKNEWYCSRPCQVKCWKTHKPICDLLCQ